MYLTPSFLLALLSASVISCTFVHVTQEPFLSMGWTFKYDPAPGVAVMRSSFKVSPNDTCHVYKLTDRQRHDIHSTSGEFKVEIMMIDAVVTHHGEPMTAQELNKTSYPLWKFCEHQLHFMKYNFYV
eukprot:XP_011430266.1 PREDICTED: uncharacterized protein LOC105330335 isoform X2 [Crassostrea gigas]